MQRQVTFLDVESTGANPAIDRVITLAISEVNIETWEPLFTGSFQFNPTIKIPAEATEIHGIKDEDVREMPTFRAMAHNIHARLKGKHLAGFCLRQFDVPILWEEFYRSGITWDLSGVLIIDAGIIFKKKEARTLEAAVKFYCNQELTGAHNALNDTLATANVFRAQLERYEDLKEMAFEDLAEFTKQNDNFDLAGKIVVDEKGFPVYNIGDKAKGTRVKDNPSFGEWMLGKDFPEETKICLRRYLASLREPKQQHLSV